MVKNRVILEGALDKGQQTKLKLKVSDWKITLSSGKGYFKFWNWGMILG